MIVLWSMVLAWCSSPATPEVAVPAENSADAAIDLFDAEAKILIDNLDKDEIERLKGQGNPIQVWVE